MTTNIDVSLVADQSMATLTLSQDRKTVRWSLMALPVDGLPEPLAVHIDLDARLVGELVEQLAAIRTQMLPIPT